ncbi:MAG: hypothetical protein AAB662_04215 [Patescibacteria group bacterium]
MVWQDIVLTFGQILFIIALFPSVIGKSKPALSTSLLTGFVLAVFSLIYITLHLWFAATTTSIASLTWFILAYQKYRKT